ncbi:MAG: tRNA-i(6)A37 methylthiotransferase [uncultured Acidimicrobiales bacterium]|uniref:tRNA-2-methylthio-N(6)-dimethylallyladenosine synthase n=1 Tax=uncultured Acidimicrobiales bacterium TaxID=310071 RepID=A0A6J4IPP1_9ACTN|nr:MAG: tRNA-i(6)A37 methylthiotransferase [uncultured Acidimicrobiales bacterium]
MTSSAPPPGTFHVRTFGCQMNEHDGERISGLLEAQGLQPVAAAGEADVVVLTTCTIRENADNKLYGTLGHLKSLKQRRPGMQIAVGGCTAQRDGRAILDRAPFVDVVFGTHNVGAVGHLLAAARATGRPQLEVLDGPEPDSGAWELPARRDVPWSAWVSIQTGCNNSCAFCIVPAVRGPEVSRPLDDLVAEVDRLAAGGVTEITLLGQNVNSYGRDLTHRRPLFAELLRRVGAVDGIRRVRYTSPHPKDLRPETIAAMAQVPAVCEHLHYPLQSGSDRVLAAMHRGYTAERYLRQLAEARAAVADLAVTTDIIVGFPGETDDDAERTLEVAAAADLDSAYTFVFSPRPGTEAADMADRFVPAEVVAARFERLRHVIDRAALQRNQARVGRTEEVVVEGPSRKDAAVLTGRTRQSKLVHFPASAGARPPRAGSYALVEVTAAAPTWLRGRLVEVTAGPRHKTRLPLAVG